MDAEEIANKLNTTVLFCENGRYGAVCGLDDGRVAKVVHGFEAMVASLCIRIQDARGGDPTDRTPALPGMPWIDFIERLPEDGRWLLVREEVPDVPPFDENVLEAFELATSNVQFALHNAVGEEMHGIIGEALSIWKPHSAVLGGNDMAKFAETFVWFTEEFGVALSDMITRNLGLCADGRLVLRDLGLGTIYEPEKLNGLEKEYLPDWVPGTRINFEVDAAVSANPPHP